MPRSQQPAKRPPPAAQRIVTWVQARWSDCIVWGCTFLLAAIVLGVHAHKYPDFAGFWAGSDQHRYLDAAQAWAAGDLSPIRHHYLPFYPLMGAAFVWLTPWQPFLLPDLACLLASLAIFLRIGRRLAPEWPQAAFALCFAVAVLSGRTDAAIWVVPWSTTGSAPFQFLAVLLALRFGEQQGPGRAALFGLCVGILAGFRPSDGAVLLLTGGLYAAWRLAAGRRALRVWVLCAAAGSAGLLAGLLPAAIAHLAVFGLSAGPYVSGSAAIGLEWRLLPLRWVMIVHGAAPLLPGTVGMMFVLPWLAPGLAGLILANARRAPAGLFVAATVEVHWAVYLAYRDLQSYGLWRFYNVHYFKWTFPFLVLWAAQLVLALCLPRQRRAAILACFNAFFLLRFHLALLPPTPLQITASPHGAVLPDAALALDRAIMLPLRGTWQALYFGDFTLQVGGQDYANTRDFKILPVGDGALLLPLRPMPKGTAVLQLPEDVGLDTALLAESVPFGIR